MLRLTCRLACSVVLLASALATPSAAQPSDKRTLFTFSGPVAMPGVTLPAGQYLFRLADPNSTRSVVQVLSSDGRKPYGMFFSLRAQRVQPAATPEVRFMETAAGMPAAIKTWWYPGELGGYELIYPKEQARRLAQGAAQPVLTTQSQSSTTEQTNTSDLARVSSSGQETPVSNAEPTASAPGGTSQQGEIASSATQIADAVVPAPFDPTPIAASQAAGRTRVALPQTASPVPLVAAFGVLAGFAGIVLWAGLSPRV